MSKRIVYKNCKVAGKITDIEVTDSIFTKIAPIDEEGIDLGGLDVFPGLIDIHTHGSNGHSVYGVADEKLVNNVKELCKYFAKNGITNQIGIMLLRYRHKRTVHCISLSATGSSTLPNSLIQLFLLAR